MYCVIQDSQGYQPLADKTFLFKINYLSLFTMLFWFISVD